MEYAVINTGGKQYTVYPGLNIRVEKIPHADEEILELDKVLLVSKNGNLKVGNPLVDGAIVKAEVVADGKAQKITVVKYKPKIRYKKKTGHRQQFTELKITEILDGSKVPVRKRATPTRRKKTDGS